MSRKKLLLILAVLVLLSPYLGLPYGYLMALLPVLGILIAAAVLIRPRSLPSADHAPRQDSAA